VEEGSRLAPQKFKDEFELGWDGEGIPFQNLTEKQWQILESALLVFTEKGFSAATTSEIAKQAGVAEGTIFRHFKTKKDILLAVLTPLLRNMVGPHVVRSLQKIVDQNSDKPLNEWLMMIMEDRYRLIQKNQKLLQFVLTEAQYHPELREVFVRDVVGKVRDFAMDMVKAKQASGELRADLDPWVFVRAMMGSIAFCMISRNFFSGLDQEGDLQQDLSGFADLLLYGAIPRDKGEGKA
jgi:AcrR family transcriptional regulator